MVVSPRADKPVATLDEIMAALKSGQCAIDVEPGNRPSPIEIIKNVHKRQKEQGEWRDSQAEKKKVNGTGCSQEVNWARCSQEAGYIFNQD
ncbi:hypothetical protein Tco_1129595 [Tanacetum coccineum]